MIAYGVTLGYGDCMRADTILGKLRFPTPPARRSRMMHEQVNEVRQKAHLEPRFWAHHTNQVAAGFPGVMRGIYNHGIIFPVSTYHRKPRDTVSVSVRIGAG